MKTIASLEECFTILEIPFSSSIDQVRQARRQLAFVWHPDRFSSNPNLQELATRKLRDINAAHDRLVYYFKNGDQDSWIEMQRRASERLADEKLKAEARRHSNEKREEELLRIKTELQIVKMEYDASKRRAEEIRQESIKRLEARWVKRYRRVRLVATITSILFLISSIGYFFVP